MNDIQPTHLPAAGATASPIPAAEAPPKGADSAALQRVEQNLDRADRDLRRAETADIKVSIVLPVFNERQTIDQIIRKVLELPLCIELLVVDDGSTDGTFEALQQFVDHPDVSLFRHQQNRGKGAALQTGFAAATGDVVAIQDADLEYDPNDIVMLLTPIVRGACDVVYGSRFLANEHQDPSWLHRTGNRALTWLSNRFTGQNLTDMETCYKVMRRSVLENIQLYQNRFGVEPELTAKISRLGTRIYELPVSYNSRGYAEGKKIGVKDGLNAIWCIFWYGLACRNTVPARS